MSTPPLLSRMGGVVGLRAANVCPNTSLGAGADIKVNTWGDGVFKTCRMVFDGIPITLTAGTNADYGNVKLGDFDRAEYMFFVGGAFQVFVTPGSGSGTIAASKTVECAIGTEAGDDDATSLTATEENIIVGSQVTSASSSITAISHGLTSNAPVAIDGTAAAPSIYFNLTCTTADLIGATGTFYLNGWVQFSYICCGNRLTD